MKELRRIPLTLFVKIRQLKKVIIASLFITLLFITPILITKTPTTETKIDWIITPKSIAKMEWGALEIAEEWNISNEDYTLKELKGGYILLINASSNGFELQKSLENIFLPQKSLLFIYICIGRLCEEIPEIRIKWKAKSEDIEISNVTEPIRLDTLIYSPSSWPFSEVIIPLSLILPGNWSLTVNIIGSPNSRVSITYIGIHFLSTYLKRNIKEGFLDGIWTSSSIFFDLFLAIIPRDSYYVTNIFMDMKFPREKKDYIAMIAWWFFSSCYRYTNGYWIGYQEPHGKTYPFLYGTVEPPPFTAKWRRHFEVSFRDMGFLLNKIYSKTMWIVFSVRWSPVVIGGESKAPLYFFFIGPWSFTLGFTICKIYDAYLYNWAGSPHRYILNITILPE